MVDWPGTLPQFKLTGIKNQRQSGKIRSSVDTGPAIVRRRYTAAVTNLDIPMTFTNAEKAAFDTFYISDLVEGTLPFNWTDPTTGSTVSMRLREELAPSFVSSGGGTFKRWDTTLAIEVLP